MAIKEKDLKVLFAHSGNQCAFDDCVCPIIEDSGIVTGECAHIAAKSKNGPRYDASMSSDLRDSYTNLILLCSRHHTIIDADTTNYTVDKLLKMKQDHESKFSAEQFRINNDVLQKFILSSQIHTANLDRINSMADSLSAFRASIDAKADILEVYKTLLAGIESFINFGNIIVEDALRKHYYGDIVNGYYNTATIVSLEMQHLLVKILELIVLQDDSYYKRLMDERSKLEELHKTSFID